PHRRREPPDRVPESGRRVARGRRRAHAGGLRTARLPLKARRRAGSHGGPAGPMDYKATLNLPRTDFPMKANLAQREPETVRRWAETRVYERLLAANAGNRASSCTTGRPTPTATSTSARRSTRC